MRTITNIVSVVFLILIFSCNTKLEKLQNTKMSIETSIHNFGNIPAKKEVTTIFIFENTGEHPLLISDVKTSCGCTVPEWPKEKIKSGNKGEIKVIYDAKYPGRFTKTISVFYNGKDSPKELIIKGEVAYPEE